MMALMNASARCAPVDAVTVSAAVAPEVSVAAVSPAVVGWRNGIAGRGAPFSAAMTRMPCSLPKKASSLMPSPRWWMCSSRRWWASWSSPAR